MASKSSTHNVVPKLYNDIIKDVISAVRDDFMNESIDESVLDDLNKLWLKKLDDTGATRTITSSGISAINKNVQDTQPNGMYVGKSTKASNLTLPSRSGYTKTADGKYISNMSFDSTPAINSSMNGQARYTVASKVGNSSFSRPNQNNRRLIQIQQPSNSTGAQQKYQIGVPSGGTVNRTVRPNPVKQYGQPRTGGVVHSTAPVNISPNNQRQAVIKQNVINTNRNRAVPLYSGQIVHKSIPNDQTHQPQTIRHLPTHQQQQQQQNSSGQMLQNSRQQSQNAPNQQHQHEHHQEQASQLNDSYSSSEYIEPQYVDSQAVNQQQLYFSQTDGPLGDDEFDSDSSVDDSDDETEEIANADAGEAENPLGSDDDLDGADDDEAIFETDNQIVCQYDKIQRVKNRWRFCLKDGIMHLHGRDFVFQKATGEGDW